MVITASFSLISDEFFFSNLSHPNVVRMFGLYVDVKGNHYMVMELVAKGSLKGMLVNVRPNLNLKEKLDMYDYMRFKF